MPFYEYECKSCGNGLEAMQKISDAPLKKCPSCGRSQLGRLMSAPVFRLKGGGWYETDFKTDKDGKRNLADRPEIDTAKSAEAKAGDGKAGDAKAGDAKAADAKPDSGTKADAGSKSSEKEATKKAAPAAREAAKRSPSRRVNRAPAASKAVKKAPLKAKTKSRR